MSSVARMNSMLGSASRCEAESLAEYDIQTAAHPDPARGSGQAQPLVRGFTPLRSVVILLALSGSPHHWASIVAAIGALRLLEWSVAGVETAPLYFSHPVRGESVSGRCCDFPEPAACQMKISGRANCGLQVLELGGSNISLANGSCGS